MIAKTFTVGLLVILCGGCASPNIVPAGKDTFMVNGGGWPRMNGFAVESECYQAANQFCAKRGLIMIPLSTTTKDGQVFAHNASCKLVFKAVASTNTVSADSSK